MPWFVYIVRCNDGTLYTGIATDIEKRIRRHNTGKDGAKYTKPRRPVSLVFSEACTSRSAALKREYQIKNLSVPAKRRMIDQQMPSNPR